jgi:hypothetical protein
MMDVVWCTAFKVTWPGCLTQTFTDSTEYCHQCGCAHKTTLLLLRGVLCNSITVVLTQFMKFGFELKSSGLWCCTVLWQNINISEDLACLQLQGEAKCNGKKGIHIGIKCKRPVESC